MCRIYWNNFQNNRSLKALRIILEYVIGQFPGIKMANILGE